MGLLILIQVILDLAFIALATLLLMERTRNRSLEDPRLSRGLQLLSSKIAILQDLMDRSEITSKQLTQLVDTKQQDIQERIEEAETHLHKLKRVVEKSQEAVRIFETGLPHHEIVEKQNNEKYAKAAKLAHQGIPLHDLAQQVDLPQGELEMIVKVNRDQLRVQDPDSSTIESKTLAESPKEPKIRPVIFKKITREETLKS